VQQSSKAQIRGTAVARWGSLGDKGIKINWF